MTPARRALFAVEEDEEAAEARQRALEAAAAELDSRADDAAAAATAAGGGGVRYWSDYLKCELAPGSVYNVPGVWHDTAEFAGARNEVR